MISSESYEKVAAGIVQVQAELAALKRTGDNPHTGSRYVPLDAIVDTIRPLLAKQGLALVNLPLPTDPGQPVVHMRTLLLHESGQFLGAEYRVPVDRGGPQGWGSAVTYARRYLALALLNIVGDSDDDGNAAQDDRSGSSAAKAAQAPSQRRERPPEGSILTWTGTIIRIGQKAGSGPEGKTQFSIEGGDGQRFLTYNIDLARKAKAHAGTGEVVEIEYEVGRSAKFAKEVRAAGASDPGAGTSGG